MRGSGPTGVSWRLCGGSIREDCMESAKLDWKEDSLLVVSYAGRQGVEYSGRAFTIALCYRP